MNIDLPSTGCNIINSSTSFYNYSSDLRTRSLYYIYDGKAILSSSTTSTYPYSPTGTCLVTGDLVYKPEFQDVFFPALAFMFVVFSFLLIYKIFIKRLMP